MDESFLPWWLMLLLGMWAAALTIWQSATIDREIRLWAGFSALAYLVLIFVALGIGSRSPANRDQQLGTVWLFVSLTVCAGISLGAGVWMLGPLSNSIRRICYVVFTLANAGVCFLLQASEIGFGLLLVATLAAKPLLPERGRLSQIPRHLWLRGFHRFANTADSSEKLDQLWLMGITNALLACVFIGTLGYSLRYETSRTAPSPRFSALPSAADLAEIQSSSSESSALPSLFDVAFGERSDVVILLAIILFLCLAMSRGDLNSTVPLPVVASVNGTSKPEDGGPA